MAVSGLPPILAQTPPACPEGQAGRIAGSYDAFLIVDLQKRPHVRIRNCSLAGSDPGRNRFAHSGILSGRLRCKRSPNRIREIVDRLNGIGGKAPGCEIRPRGNPMEFAIEDIVHLW